MNNRMSDEDFDAELATVQEGHRRDPIPVPAIVLGFLIGTVVFGWFIGILTAVGALALYRRKDRSDPNKRIKFYWALGAALLVAIVIRVMFLEALRR